MQSSVERKLYMKLMQSLFRRHQYFRIFIYFSFYVLKISTPTTIWKSLMVKWERLDRYFCRKLIDYKVKINQNQYFTRSWNVLEKLLNLTLEDIAQGATQPVCCFWSSPISGPLLSKIGIRITTKCIYGTEMRKLLLNCFINSKM